MKSETREKDPKNVQELLDRDYKFYIIESSREYIAGLQRIIAR